MDYFKILHFNKEPFSNSPDPRFFYKSAQHVSCLQNLEVALRLRRGLNVVLGRVGTGKTTLCRRLMANLEGDHKTEAHFIFDPFFGTPRDFLLMVARLFKCSPYGLTRDEWQIKEQIKQYLFSKGVEEGKTVVLIIDEGQKIPSFCLEILREFLNYETNDSKLLQIVIFAQTEFESVLRDHQNFSDRVNLLLRLDPLSFKDTRQMIAFRLDKASERGKAGIRFSYAAMLAIYRATGGYPRRIVHLCHRIILALIVQNKRIAGLSLVRSCIDGKAGGSGTPFRWAYVSSFAAALAVWGLFEYGRVTPGHPPLPLKEPDPVRLPVEQGPSDPEKGPPFLSSAGSNTGPQPLTSAPASGSRAQKGMVPRPLNGTTAPALSEKRPPNPSVPVEHSKPFASGEVATKTAAGPNGGIAVFAGFTEASAAPYEIGRIVVRRNDMVSAMVARVYGEFTVERMHKVAQANPHIPDVNRIETGQWVTFPVLNVRSSDECWRGGVIRIHESKTLEDAYRWVNELPRVDPPLRVLPVWEASKGLTYHVVVAQVYPNEASASSTLASLPPEVSTRGEVVDGFVRGSVVLAP